MPKIRLSDGKLTKKKLTIGSPSKRQANIGDNESLLSTLEEEDSHEINKSGEKDLNKQTTKQIDRETRTLLIK
jgi:hypothetical protein